MKYSIRELRPKDYYLLNDFLYEAIFIPKGVAAPPKNIIKQPELQVYVAGFGRNGDCGLLAEADGKAVGAVWCRIMDDYGHVDDETPSLAISLFKEYRGHGIGTELLRQMLLLLKRNGWKRVSLSVQKVNYAVDMYRKAGFFTAEEKEDEYIMVCELGGDVGTGVVRKGWNSCCLW